MYMTFPEALKEARLLIGYGRNTTGHKEKIISGIGGAIGLLVVVFLGLELNHAVNNYLNIEESLFIVASIAASAVLLFAVPHGALSQPWPVIGGHASSAFIGVSCSLYIPDQQLAIPIAVGGAVLVMYYLRCIHPPGGATALAAVVGGDAVQTLGYFYVLYPVVFSAVVIVLVAVGFNALFKWRRYPAHWFYKNYQVRKVEPSARETELTQEDFFAAIQQHDSFIDITEEGLTDLLELAKQHAEKSVIHPEEIVPGRFYSNGKIGKKWSVRQVVDASGPKDKTRKTEVIYKVVAGDGAYETGICQQEHFRLWARFEVRNRDNLWVKVNNEN